MRYIKPNSENAIQASFFAWADLKGRRDPRIRALFAIPNGSNKGFAARVVFKATGLKSGVPDVFLAFPSSGFHGLFIEFKTDKGKVSDVQREWHGLLKENGYSVKVCRSLDDGIEAVEEYLSGVAVAPPQNLKGSG